MFSSRSQLRAFLGHSIPTTMSSGDDLLSTYRAKRSLDHTPEPSGSVWQPGGRLFVVHKHAARRLHFDLRLEMEGVLRSWAVPKGFSADPQDKHLAVFVEDHPVEYADFEGKIPEGNYGAGGVIVWDRGEWIALEDPLQGLKKGKLLFELRGYKLHGVWTLVKIKKSDKEWLLIKERDPYAIPGASYPEESVLSGLTVEQLKTGEDVAAPIRKELERLGAPRKRVSANGVSMMLAEVAAKPFSRAGWFFELKLDGYRLVASREGKASHLISRNGNDLAGTFPEVAKAVAALPFDHLVLDGEVVAMDEAGRPSFQRLQQRGKLTRAPDVARAAVEVPVTFFAFDLLGFEDFDVRALPLHQRKPLLRRVLPPLGAIRYLDHFERDGEALYQHVVQLDLEGIVAKKADVPYRAGRSPYWLKIRSDRTDDFVVVGFTQPKGSRHGFGALHLGQYVAGRLVYAGRAGTGFSAKQLTQVKNQLNQLVRKTAPCDGPVPPGATTSEIPLGSIPDFKSATWVEPKLVCEIRFKEWTDEGYLRHPAFLRFRDDKRPEECVRQLPVVEPPSTGRKRAGRKSTKASKPSKKGALRSMSSRAEGPRAEPAEQRTVLFSNLDKVFWPENGFTKGDLIEYYRAISAWLLPYLAERPVVLTRYPDGIHGKSFFQKDAPAFAPRWLRTERMWSEQAEREIDYFICDDQPSLLYMANMASIPLHIWASRASTVEYPDWCSLDLDPKGAAFADVIAVAQAARDLCQRINLPSFVKTTGSSGLHVMIPLARRCTHDQAKALGEVLAHALVKQLPSIATTTRAITQREGKVYVDYLQNGHGKLLVAPFSVRPLSGAPVSMPLSWSEVNPTLDIRAFTIRNAVERMQRLGKDPLIGILSSEPDLASVLDALHQEFGANHR